MEQYKVILVDDEAEVIDIMEAKIRWSELGFEVVGSAKNGVKALELVEKLQPDVVLTDIRMPYMDGLELISFKGYEDVKAGIVKWPMSVIRLASEDPQKLVDLADRIFASWRGYTDEAAMILAETDGEPHNTITPIARRRGADYELDLVLRNNLTTPEHPLGIYHPHEELHHIKKENIGLIEVMGLAILPGRLKQELAAVAEKLVSGADLCENPLTKAHADWAKAIAAKHTITAENAMEIVLQETGLVFAKVLEQAGVYSRTLEGKAAFLRFVEQV